MVNEDSAGHRALSHPMRARILAELEEGEKSPVELSKALDASLGVVSYHVRVLADAGVVDLARTSARRGAIQHHYRLRDPSGVSGSVALSAAAADKLAKDLRATVDRARAKAAKDPGDVEVTVLVHRVART